MCARRSKPSTRRAASFWTSCSRKTDQERITVVNAWQNERRDDLLQYSLMEFSQLIAADAYNFAHMSLYCQFTVEMNSKITNDVTALNSWCPTVSWWNCCGIFDKAEREPNHMRGVWCGKFIDTSSKPSWVRQKHLALGCDCTGRANKNRTLCFSLFNKNWLMSCVE